MLDDFSAVKINQPCSPSPKPPTTSSLNPSEGTAMDAAADGFSRQLQDQMAALMGNMDESPEMRREIENMMKELGGATNPASSPGRTAQDEEASKTDTGSPGVEEPFQETIRKTMERMKASGDQAGAAAQTEGSDEVLAQMLKDMQGEGFDGEAGEEGFNKMLMGMMEQLTNKEILYEPMKELHIKFPKWFEKNRAGIQPEDLKRYEEQQCLVREIVGRFERKDYSDSKPADREFIVDRMQQVCDAIEYPLCHCANTWKMQALGNPPADLVGNMSAAQDIFDEKDPGCPQQ